MIGLRRILGPQLDRAFELAGELVRVCVFYKTESSIGTGLVPVISLFAPVKALFVDYHSQDIDGSGVLLGDEKAFVRSGELAAVLAPGTGDYLTESGSGLRREVIAARQDPTGSFWVLQVRRSMSEDWGDLSPMTLAEDWGGLTEAVVFDDWQAG